MSVIEQFRKTKREREREREREKERERERQRERDYNCSVCRAEIRRKTLNQGVNFKQIV